MTVVVEQPHSILVWQNMGGSTAADLGHQILFQFSRCNSQSQRTGKYQNNAGLALFGTDVEVGHVASSIKLWESQAILSFLQADLDPRWMAREWGLGLDPRFHLMTQISSL
jgi:hypothetical protein